MPQLAKGLLFCSGPSFFLEELLILECPDVMYLLIL